MDEKPIAYEAYQKLAPHYARHIDSKPHNAFYDRPAVISLWPDLDDQNVLDAGCGPGAYTEELIRRGATVTGVDASDEMLRLAQQRLQTNLVDVESSFQLLQLDLTKPLTMFDDESFDFVNAPLCLDYIEDWTTLFKELRRILRPGGRFVFSAGHPFFDADYFSTDEYFSVEAVNAEWTGFGINVTMPGFRRSLQHFLSPVIDAGFQFEKVLEPLPTEEFKAADPVRYQSLMHRPGFLCIRCFKP